MAAAGDKKTSIGRSFGPCCGGSVQRDRTVKERDEDSNMVSQSGPRGPDGGCGWVVTLSAFFISFILDGIAFTFGLFFDELLEHFKSSQSETSAIISVLNGTYLGIGPLASVLVTAYGGRKVGVLGGLLAAAGIFFSTMAPSVHGMILLYGFAGGVGFGLVYLPAIVSVGQYFTRRRALATGIAVCGSGIGSFVFAPFCEFLIETYTWKGALWILSGVALNCIPCAMLLRPVSKQNSSRKGHLTETLLDHDCKDQSEIKEESQSISENKSKLSKMFDFSLFKSPTFVLFGVSNFLATLGFFIPFTFIPGQIVEFGMSLRQSALLLSIIGIVNTVTRLLVGWVSDRPWADSGVIFMVALWAGGAAAMLVPLLNSFGLFTIFCMLFGFSIAAYVSLRSIILAELLGVDRLTSSFGLVTMCQGAAAFMGSPIAGALADGTGGYRAPFYLSGLTIGLAGILCLPLRRLATWESRRQAGHEPGLQTTVIS